MKRAGPIRMKVKEKGWAHYDMMKVMKGAIRELRTSARAGPVMREARELSLRLVCAVC
jgi:hypothetical protein